MSDAEGLIDRVNILLVDDRPGNLLSLSGILERPDYTLMTATSGDEALARVLQDDFALILLDVAMPGMDGFEVASIIKQRERFRTIPIIFVTASVHHIEWIFKAYSVGAVDFLPKPLDPHAVRAKVAVFVELYRQKQQLKDHAARLQEFERREREREVARVRDESERRYRHLEEAIPHIVWTADAEGRIRSFNDRWFEITAIREEDALDSAWRAAVHPADVVNLAVEWDRAIGAGREFQIELRLRAADGSYRWYVNRALPETDANGRVLRWIGTLTDIDEQKHAHEELQAAIRLREDFISVASHELRTPLSALTLQLQHLDRLLKKTQGEVVTETLAKRIGSAVRNADRLALLVGSLLDVSQIARGKLELHFEELDLAALTREVAERFHYEAAQSGSSIAISASRPVSGRWDRLRIEQVIGNLLSNALKYGPGKPIAIAVDENDGVATLSVEDEGIGIEPDKLQRIFECFERGVSVQNYGGLGLGLYIVRQIVRALGGAVAVESEVGVGSRFVVSIPLRPNERHELRLFANREGEGLNRPAGS